MGKSLFFYDISLAVIFDAFKFLGVSVFGSLTFVAIFLILFRLSKGDWWIKTITLIAIILLSQNVFSLGYRAQILSLLFLVIEFWLLQFFEDKTLSKVLLLLIALMALFFIWANSHPSFFLGPLILTVFLVYQLISDIIRKSRFLAKRMLFSLFIIPISLLVTLLNPFGFRIYQEVWQHLFSPLNKMIAEWTAPDLWQILLIIVSSLTIIYLVLIRKIKADYRLILLLIFALFAVSARRSLPLYYIVAFWLISEIEIKALLTDRVRRFLNLITFTILGIGTVFVIPQINQTVAFDINYNIYCNNGIIKLPCPAIEKIKDKTGNLLNMYEHGGFLIWKLPQMKVFSDGRMPAWKDENGMSPYQVYLAIIQTQQGWNEKLTQYKTDYLLINSNTYLDLLLQQEGAQNFGWQEEYRDSLSVIYSKI